MYKKLLYKVIPTAFLFLSIFAFFKGVEIYKKVYRANVFTDSGKPVIIYIATGATYQEVLNILDSGLMIKNMKSLEWVLEKKNYKNNIKPGRYRVKNRTNNNELVNMLRSGSQRPVNVTFNNIRFPHELAKALGRQLEPHHSEFEKHLRDTGLIHSYGFNLYTFPAMFIPNTYEFYWNTSPKGVFDRMHKEYEKFWNKERLKQAEEIGLTPVEVSIIASIIDEETAYNSEKTRIAGVYINRLHRNIRLQADPTVKFAIGDYNVKRILKKHLQISSPYNTYLNDGLPPGPIRYASVAGLNAVLNYERHNYIFFCAREDFSGYHSFATNLADHNRNAEKYRQALNKRRIFR